MHLEHQPFDPVGAQAHLQVGARDDHLLDQELHDPHLLGREQLVPNRVELRHGDRDLGLVQGGVEIHRLGQDLGDQGRGAKDRSQLVQHCGFELGRRQSW